MAISSSGPTAVPDSTTGLFASQLEVVRKLYSSEEEGEGSISSSDEDSSISMDLDADHGGVTFSTL